MNDNNHVGGSAVFQVMNEIGIISQLSSAALERALPHKLSYAQFTVLNHFSRLGGSWRPQRLAKAFQVTKGAMTNTLQKLEARGFVDIIPDPDDGRAKLVTLTEKGAGAYRDALLSLMPIGQGLMENFDNEAFEAALPFLTELRVYLDVARTP